jgi:hypothetical protein
MSESDRNRQLSGHVANLEQKSMFDSNSPL